MFSHRKPIFFIPTRISMNICNYTYKRMRTGILKTFYGLFLYITSGQTYEQATEYKITLEIKNKILLQTRFVVF